MAERDKQKREKCFPEYKKLRNKVKILREREGEREREREREGGGGGNNKQKQKNTRILPKAHRA